MLEPDPLPQLSLLATKLSRESPQIRIVLEEMIRQLLGIVRRLHHQPIFGSPRFKFNL
jgi:hypothetical protein